MKLPIKIVGCLMMAYVVKSAVLRTDSDSFAEYVVKFDKQYQTAEEYQRRFHIWQESIKFIQKHNDEESAGIHSYRAGINAFTDMTHEEYKDKMLTYKSKQNTENGQTVSMYSGGYDDLPDSVDWKAKGYVTAVGNQGQCGSCWAFTATGALEGAHKKKTGMLVNLSEQNLMDCSSKQGNDGCEGGMMEYSYKYVKENGGIDTEKSYPYNVSNPQVGKCKYTEKDRGATCTGYVDLPKGNEKALQEAVANIGPIAIAVDASHLGFEMYKSGVYDDPNCSSKNIEHSMVIVGYGVENGKEYYYCKNSWGTSWGDNGYIKMVRNKNNQCGIATEASYPTV